MPFNKWAHIIGVNVKETNKEIPIAVVKVMANSLKSRPTRPSINKRGINTATNEILIESTVKPTSLTPFRAACLGFKPFSIWREIFSSTTIASSTTKPVATVNAINDRLFKLKPHKYMAEKVPINETGTATAGIKVARPERRNKNTTKITSATAIANARSTSANEARIVGVLS